MGRPSGKDKKKDKGVNKEFEIECFNCELWTLCHWMSLEEKRKKGHVSHLEWHGIMSIKWKIIIHWKWGMQ